MRRRFVSLEPPERLSSKLFDEDPVLRDQPVMIAQSSRHACAVIGGVVHDTHPDPGRTFELIWLPPAVGG